MQMPPLYGALEPLSAAHHGRLRWADAGLAFAERAAALPLTLAEIGRAARHAPIVFGPEPPHAPFLLWPALPLPGAGGLGPAFVPAYLRRYPFLLARLAPGREELALCIDPRAPQLSESTGEPLFDAAGRPTPLAERAFHFAQEVEQGLLAAQSFGSALARMGLLAPAALPEGFQGGGRKGSHAAGFFAVDRAAFARLPAERLALLRDEGFLEPLVAHFLSVLALEG